MMLDFQSLTPDAMEYPIWAVLPTPKQPSFVVPGVTIGGSTDRTDNVYGTRSPQQYPPRRIVRED